MIQYLYWGLFLGGMTLVYFAMKSFQDTRKLMENGIRTNATVIDLIKKDSNDGVTYKPVFEFLDKVDVQYQFTSNVSSYPPAYKIGEKVKIIYNRNDKTKVKTISFWGLYRWTIILLSIAGPLVTIGGGYLLYIRI